MKIKKILSLALCLCIISAVFPFAVAVPDDGDATAKHYTYSDIANQMLDMRHAAKIPSPGEASSLWSSSDRAAQFNTETDKYDNWSSNSDWTGYISREQISGYQYRYLIADMEGPGVIWRIWCAKPANAIIEICIDDDTYETPTITKNWSSLFTGNDSYFSFPGLSYTNSAQGRNCYQPITYNKSCKIYIRNTEFPLNFPYQVTYSTLPEGSEVESSSGSLSEEQSAALSAVNDFFQNKIGENPNSLSDVRKSVKQWFNIPAKGKTTVLDFDGAGAIAQFKIRPDIPFQSLSENEILHIMKELTVSMYWDDESTPSVWAPLCDFFGDSGGCDVYRTLPMGYTENGEFYCYIYMPFKTGARIVIGNDGAVGRGLNMDIAVVPLEGDADDYLRFHAKWHRGLYSENADRQPDYSVLRTEGAGRFLGLSLHAYKADDNRDPAAFWWGEGDEKFFVDGEKFPSTFGTGTDDYFGYAWGDPAAFAAPYHAQTFAGESTHLKGHKSNVRYQLNDNVPFFDSFDGFIEKYYLTSAEYGITSYWYLSEDGTDSYEPKSLKARTDYFGERGKTYLSHYEDDFSSGKVNLLSYIADSNIYASGDKNVALENKAALIDYRLHTPETDPTSSSRWGRMFSHYVAGSQTATPNPDPAFGHDPALGNRVWFAFDLGALETFDSYQELGTTLSRWDSDMNLNLRSWTMEITNDDNPNWKEKTGWTQVDQVADNRSEVVNRVLPEPVTARYVRFIVDRANWISGAGSNRVRIGAIKIFESDSVPKIEARVSPTTIVTGCAANVNVNVVSSGMEEDVITITLFNQTLEVGDDGLARFRFEASEVPEAGVYSPVVRVNGEERPTEGRLTVVPLDNDIWTMSVIPGSTDTALGFLPEIAPKKGSSFIVLVNGSEKAFIKEGNSLIIPCVVNDGDVIVVKNVKFPVLFPSYSFTFTTTYIAQA